MAPPPLNPHTRYVAKGRTKCYWVPFIANILAPTRTEIDAGIDLSPQLMSAEGWQIESEAAPTPNLATEFTGSIPAGTSAEDSSITMYQDRNGQDVRQVLPRDTPGNMVWMHGGDIPGNPTMDVHPVRIGSLGKPVTLDAEASSIQVNCNITDEPAENLVIPA
ncbi:hypothetical protein [Actinomadura flavalba]|uniref:phage tail tube protein n=1 Tax=Actinomadura flavalba TaxID=1120938 RepID=UPI0003689E03|nr:hypothetical protein [Actinomadura flavalba]